MNLRRRARRAGNPLGPFLPLGPSGVSQGQDGERRRVFPFLWLWRVGPHKGHLRWVVRWWIADRRQRRQEERRASR